MLLWSYPLCCHTLLRRILYPWLGCPSQTHVTYPRLALRPSSTLFSVDCSPLLIVHQSAFANHYGVTYCSSRHFYMFLSFLWTYFLLARSFHLTQPPIQCKIVLVGEQSRHYMVGSPTPSVYILHCLQPLSMSYFLLFTWSTITLAIAQVALFDILLTMVLPIISLQLIHHPRSTVVFPRK